MGGIEYLVNSNDNADSVEPEDRFKYIDDNVSAEAVKIKKLVPITRDMDRPLNYRDRTLHELPEESCLQTKLTEMDS